MARKFFSVNVIERMYTPEEFAAFIQKYEAMPRRTGWASRVVSETDKQIHADFVGGMKMAELRKKYGKSNSFIQSGILRVLRG